MVVVNVVIVGAPVVVRVRYGMYEAEFTGTTILDILTSPVLQKWNASGTHAYARDGLPGAPPVVCHPDRRLIAGETIEMFKGKPR